MKQKLYEFDLFYLSYDEPKCEEFYADLRAKAPWVKRVHGVKGFDNAHKECARRSETEYFVTIDGDNILDNEFFDLEVDLTPYNDDVVLSWASVNEVNGLTYGNGSTKLWSKKFTLGMQTHEATDGTDMTCVEFCFDPKYISNPDVYSTTYPNGSPYQAWRAGFREGVKMLLDQGKRVPANDIHRKIYKGNLDRFKTWASVGADVKYGEWCILGARLGALYAVDNRRPLENINDFEWFDKEFEEQYMYIIYEANPYKFEEYSSDEMNKLLEQTARRFKHVTGITLETYSPEVSKHIKNKMVIR